MTSPYTNTGSHQHAKNPNKNPVAERAIQELEFELLRQEPLGGAVSSLTLAIATDALNSHIRSRGLSSQEMWTQRDQFSNVQIPLGDNNLIHDVALRDLLKELISIIFRPPPSDLLKSTDLGILLCLLAI